MSTEKRKSALQKSNQRWSGGFKGDPRKNSAKGSDARKKAADDLRRARATRVINSRTQAKAASNKRNNVPVSLHKGSMGRRAAAIRLLDKRESKRTGLPVSKVAKRRVAGLHSNSRHGLVSQKKGSAARRAAATALRGQRTAKQKAASIANLRKGRSSVRRKR